MRDTLERQANKYGTLNQTVFFHDFVSAEDANQFVAQSDVAMVSLEPGILNYALPSKTSVYACTGTYIVATIEPETELATSLETHGLGQICALDANILAGVVHELYKNRNIIRKQRQQRQAVATELFGEDTAIRQWLQLLDNGS